jgi:Leucine-rich repeat (LRR) protein
MITLDHSSTVNFFGRKTESPFLTLARQSDLDQETAFAICRMIDMVGHELVDDWDWNWLEDETVDFRSLIDPSLLAGAWKLLSRKDWFSLQTTNDEDKRISTIAPLEGLTNLKRLVLQNNLIEDLGPVAAMSKLKKLHCYRNRVTDLTPLRDLKLLEEVSLGENPIASFQVLEELPNLEELQISPDQFAVFAECKRLPRLRSLAIESDGALANFSRVPEMPLLKVLKAWHVGDFRGIEQLGALEDLSSHGGQFGSLEPLRTLKSLTHVSLSTDRPLDVSPLAGLHALRRISITSPKVEGVGALSGLPALREVDINSSDFDAKELEAVQAGLDSWDAEFKTDTRSIQPSLEIEVVDQETFDHFDSKAAYGIAPGESNEEMHDSERQWLLEEIREALSAKFEDDTDFYLPHTSGFQRTERVILYSVSSYEAFRDIATAIQQVLCHAKNDWIIWCQSLLVESPEEQEVPEGAEDFIVWIYPDKIMATKDNARIIRKLIEWNQ